MTVNELIRQLSSNFSSRSQVMVETPKGIRFPVEVRIGHDTDGRRIAIIKIGGI